MVQNKDLYSGLKKDLKKDLRDDFKEKLKSLSEREKLQKSVEICAGLREVLPSSGLVAAFIGIGDEPDLSSLIWAESLSFDFCLPRVEKDQLKFYKVKSKKDLTLGTFGIQEPDPDLCELVPYSAIEIFLVPGRAFDRKGYRLGRGKGFYDRTFYDHSFYDQNLGEVDTNKTSALESIKSDSSRPQKWGVGFALQFLTGSDLLPVEKHDVKMDLVITENFILQTQPSIEVEVS